MPALSARVVTFFKAIAKRDDVLVEISNKGRKVAAKQLAWAWDGFPKDVRDLYAGINGFDLRWRFIDSPALGFLHMPGWKSIVFLDDGETMKLDPLRTWDERFAITRVGADLVVTGPKQTPMGGIADYVEAQLAGRLLLHGEEVVDLSERLAEARRPAKAKVGQRAILRAYDGWSRGTAVALAKGTNKKPYTLLDLDIGERIWAGSRFVTGLVVQDRFEKLVAAGVGDIPASERLEHLACLDGESWRATTLVAEAGVIGDPWEQPCLRSHAARILAALSPEEALTWVVEALESETEVQRVELGDDVSVDSFDRTSVDLDDVRKALVGALIVRLVAQPVDVSSLEPHVAGDDALKDAFERLPGATKVRVFSEEGDTARAQELGLDPAAPLPAALV